mgnify:CR=1 FL=1
MKKVNFDVKLPAFVDRIVYVDNYGARPYCYTIEDASRNADAINRAINYISEKGGGTVVIPEGIWFTAPIEIKSDVELRIEKNAILKFSKDIDQYPLIITNYEGQECIRAKSPITAENAINIGITGGGVIDGSGDLWRPVKQFKLTDRQWEALMKKSQYTIDTKEGGIWMPTESSFKGNEHNIQLDAENALEKASEYYDFYRPVMVSLRHCKRILLDGVTFMNSPAWNIHPFFCKNLTVRNVTVSNPYYAQNGDGIDVESCKKVHIHNCTFETGDDAICLKSGKNAVARQIEGPCEDVYIHDCLVNKGHGGFVIGSEMSRGIKNVLVENCTFLGTDVGVRIKSALGRGGVIENINVKNIKLLVYTIMGLLAGLGGALQVSIYASAMPDMQQGGEMDVIAACVIGGVSMSGGRGTVLGALLGSLILATIAKALPLIPFFDQLWLNTIKGVIILVVVVVNIVLQRTADKNALKGREM